MVASTIHHIEVAGPYDLAQSVEFGFGQRHSERFDGLMRLAFCVDGFAGHAGVEVRDVAGDGSRLELQVHARGDVESDAIVRQVARILSVDHDAAGYVAVGERDPIVAGLLRERPGLRPPLFHSPYEAAAWSVLSARFRQAAAARDALAHGHGESFELAGRQLAAFPTPAALLAVRDLPGVPAGKLERLHGVARAALEGQLDLDRLHALGPDSAIEALQELPGIGPFYASLVVIRACGFTDVLTTIEPKLLARVGDLYGLGGPATAAQLEEIAAGWRPFRTWVTVLVRATNSAG